MNRLTAGEKLHGYEARMRSKNGSIRHVLINSSVYFEHGKFVHTRCFTRDNTARREAQEALQEAQNQLHQHAAELERQVALRTADLERTVQSLEGMCYIMAHDLGAPLRALVCPRRSLRRKPALRSVFDLRKRFRAGFFLRTVK